MIEDVQDFSKKIVDKFVVVDASTTSTVWEFKDQVARMLGLGPRYIKLQM